MSSHREAPEISKDPAADSTDTYAFVSTNPAEAGTVTILTNYIPLQFPAGGPNFFEFDDDVLYSINIDNDGDGRPDVTYEFRFTTRLQNEDTFLYNTGPINALDSPNFNRRQTYTVTEVRSRHRTTIATGLRCPPCNIGPRSTPGYAALADAATYARPNGIKLFAGQRLDGFYVDLGSVFDLAALRPFQSAHLINMPGTTNGVNALQAFNVHTIAIQVPISRLTADSSTPGDPMSRTAVIGVWGSAARQKGTFNDERGRHCTGPWQQVSRLGNPLFNEVIVPMGDKDRWNRLGPHRDSEFAKYVARPELAGLLPVLYPGVFPNLAALSKDRADLLAILLTGIPAGIVPGFQNFTGTTQADMLRLNVAIPPSASPAINGILGGDLAGFPNGRRVFDNVVAIELRAVAGATFPLVDPTYTPDAAAGAIYDITDSTLPSTVSYLDRFPYLDNPVSGYDVVPLSVRS